MNQDYTSTPAKTGMPLWGKIALGCSVALVLGIGACGVGGYFIYKKGMAKLQEAAAKPYQDFHAATQDLRTPEGQAAFYASHPGLKGKYPDVQAFQEAAKGWSDRLGSLPATMPDLMGLMKQGGFQMNANSQGGRKAVTFRIKTEGKGWISGEWENDQLVDIKAE